MKINIIFFGPLVKACGCRNYEFHHNCESLSLEQLRNMLIKTFPSLKKFKYTFAVNQCMAGKDSIVNEGDEVALLPPISGGNMKYLTNDEITHDFISRLIGSATANCGSVLTFKGIIREDKNDNTTVEQIIYSAYDTMAEKEISRIINTSIKEFGLIDVILKHRTGRVNKGETAFFVAVLSSHRKEGIEAIDFIIDEVKKKVPIWKEEFFSDGSSSFKSGQLIT